MCAHVLVVCRLAERSTYMGQRSLSCMFGYIEPLFESIRMRSSNRKHIPSDATPRKGVTLPLNFPHVTMWIILIEFVL